MKSLANVIEGFFDNVRVGDHRLELHKLGFSEIGEYNGRTCWKATLKGTGKIKAVSGEYEYSEEKLFNNPDAFIMPESDGKGYLLLFVCNGQVFYTYLYSYSGQKVNKRAVRVSISWFADGSKRIDAFFGKNVIENWESYDDFVCSCATIPNFDSVSLPGFIENIIYKVSDLDLND